MVYYRIWPIRKRPLTAVYTAYLKGVAEPEFRTWGEGREGGPIAKKKVDMSTKTSAYRTSAGSVLQQVLVTLSG